MRTGWWAARQAGQRLSLARYWQAAGDLDEAARHAHHALRLVQATQAPANELVAAVARTAARIERDRDRPKASDAVLAWVIDAVGGGVELAELAGLLVELGDGHRRAGRYPEAVEALERARSLRTGEAAALCTMLGIVAKELGAFDWAAHWYSRVAAIHAVIGASTADQAALQHNLAGLAHAEGRFADAEVHARRAVALRRPVAGPDDVDVAADTAVLAAAIAGQHRHLEARELLVQAMDACAKARPPRRYEIAVHLHSLAAIDQATGRRADAERRYRQALALKEELLGPDHPEVALVLNNLGTLLDDAECFAKALAIAERCFPAEHPLTSAIRHNLSPTQSIKEVRAGNCPFPGRVLPLIDWVGTGSAARYSTATARSRGAATDSMIRHARPRGPTTTRAPPTEGVPSPCV